MGWLEALKKEGKIRHLAVTNFDAGHMAELHDAGAEVVTDQVKRFTPSGILLESGRELAADIVVLATGLNLKFMGGIDLTVDGSRVDIAEQFVYRGMMLSDVPNLGQVMGYTNSSWTLKADLTAGYVCRLLNHMTETGLRQCTPRLRAHEQGMAGEDWIDGFSSGYIQRKLSLLPKQGTESPWRNTHNYALDRKTIGRGPIEDGVLQFSNPAPS